MKVLAVVILIIGSAAALGSGPYLPSGWKPEGPAFYLPSEPRPPVVAVPLPDLVAGSEASGSAFLREYGPPKIQALPEVATEQAFVVLAAKFSEEEKAEAEVVETEAEAATESFADLKYEVVEDSASTTEAAVVEAAVEEMTEDLAEQPAAEGRSLNIEVEASVAQEEVNNVAQVEIESIEQVTQEVASEQLTQEVASEQLTQEVAEVEAVSGEVQAELVEKVKAVEEGVKNIAEAIVSLEKEIVAEQVQLSQDLSAVKSVEFNSGSVQQVPEGFLEYGPPGFREYGPPKQDNFARVSDEVKSEEEKIESNETRRRRFSPKFRSTKAKKH